jgi:hypothetical protein
MGTTPWSMDQLSRRQQQKISICGKSWEAQNCASRRRYFILVQPVCKPANYNCDFGLLNTNLYRRAESGSSLPPMLDPDGAVPAAVVGLAGCKDKTDQKS